MNKRTQKIKIFLHVSEILRTMKLNITQGIVF